MREEEKAKTTLNSALCTVLHVSKQKQEAGSVVPPFNKNPWRTALFASRYPSSGDMFLLNTRTLSCTLSDRQLCPQGGWWPPLVTAKSSLSSPRQYIYNAN